jgi:hypothetical protein
VKSWRPTRKDLPCGGCGDTGGHCTVSGKGDVCLCRKSVVSPHPVKQRDGSLAYVHPMSGDAPARPAKPDGPAIAKAKLSEGELKLIVKRHQSAMSQRRLDLAVASLGLCAEALRQYGVGYDDATDALSFPMVDGDQKLVGVRLRLCDRTAARRQMCVRGSSNGLFVPAGFDCAVAPENGVDDFGPLLLLLPEGPTDAAAAWQCGFAAVGRANCSIGGPMIARLLRRCRTAGSPRDVVIVSDNDPTHWTPDHVPYWPGWEGAIGIAGACLLVAASVRVVMPPAGAKDLREAVKEADGPIAVGRLGAKIVAMIGAAPPVDAAWVAFRREQVGQVKAVCGAILAGRAFADDAARDAARAAAEAEAKGLVRQGRATGWLAGRKAAA